MTLLNYITKCQSFKSKFCFPHSLRFGIHECMKVPNVYFEDLHFNWDSFKCEHPNNSPASSIYFKL